MFNEIFSKKLQDEKIKPYHLSKAIGLSSGLVSDYVNGKKSPTVENLVKIADFLGVSVDYLLGIEPEQKESTPDALRSAIISRVEALSDRQAELLLAYLDGLQAQLESGSDVQDVQ